MRRPTAEGVTDGTGKITHLPDVHRDVWVVWAGRDGEGVPLRGAHARHLQEQPLSGFVFHTGLFELDFHGVVRMSDDFVDLCGSSSSDFAVDAFDEVDAATPEFPPPAFVADAVVPEQISRKRRVGLGCISHEATGSVSVHGQQEGNEQVMGVPEGLVGLSTDLGVGGGEHQQHAQHHDVAGDTARLSIMDLHRGLRPQLVLLDVEEVDVMCQDVDAGEQ